MSDLPVVAVVGRANVGKSTLVNRFVGRRAAIEAPQPGITRDRHGFDVDWNGVAFHVVDTGGYEPHGVGLDAKVRAQAEYAARTADLTVLVVDVATGITTDDLEVVRGLRRTDTPILLVANKVDSAGDELNLHDLHALGLGDPVPVSALHGRSSGDLLDEIVNRLRDLPPKDRVTDDAIPVAIVGRPNVGKSSLFNRLVGEERSIVHDEPGTTRDAVDTVVEVDGRTYRFIDTAGWRRHADARGPERFALSRLFDAIDRAAVVLQIIDASEGTTDQDQRVSARISEGGRACVLVLNKWDLIDDPDEPVAHARDQLRFLPWASLVRTSALTGRGATKLLPMIDAAYAAWQRRVTTGELNAWLRDGLEGVPLGTTERGRPIRIRYATQAAAGPPTFIFFGNGRVTTSGMRALENRLRAEFPLEGTPIKVVVRRKQRPEVE